MPQRRRRRTLQVQIPKEIGEFIKLVAERNALGVVRKWARRELLRARLPYMRKIRKIRDFIWDLREKDNILTSKEIETQFAKIEAIKEKMQADKKVIKYTKRVSSLNESIKAYGIDATEGKIPSALVSLGFDINGMATKLAAELESSA